MTESETPESETAGPETTGPEETGPKKTGRIVYGIPILYEDGEALVIDKPAGLPIDRPRKGGRALINGLDEFKLGFHRQPTPVHRLDTDTSGCLLLARNPKALKRFAAAFEQRQVEKTYIGLVAGEITEQQGTIELALTKVSSAERGWRMIADEDGKASVTHWEKLEELEGGLTLVKFLPLTGRTHQIRIHALAGLGHALVGDPVYGEAHPSAKRTMLHANRIVIHREGKPSIAATSPLPADFSAFGIQTALYT